MKKLLFLFNICIIIFVAYMVFLYEKLEIRNGVSYLKNTNIKHGDTIQYYDSKNIKLKHQYKNGKLDGISIKYYDNGQIDYYKEYENNILRSAHYYNVLGDLILKVKYDTSLLEIRNGITYIKGTLVKHGESVSFYENIDERAVKAIKFYHKKAAVADDEPFTYFKENRPKKSLVTYRYDKIHGSVHRYYTNEKEATKEIYKDDLLIEGRYYNHLSELVAVVKKGNGQAIAYYDYSDEYLVSDHYLNKKFIYPNYLYYLRTRTVKNYRNGKYHGEVLRYYNYRERLHSKDLYKDGDIYQSFTYYSNGKLKESKEYQKKQLNGKRLRYHINGVLAKDESYKNNQLDGKAIHYDKNKKEIAKLNYKEGKLLEGEFFQSNGKSASKIQKGNGKAIYYYSYGRISQQDIYKDGILVERKNYSYRGKLISQFYYKNTLLWQGNFYNSKGNVVGEIKNGNGVINLQNSKKVYKDGYISKELLYTSKGQLIMEKNYKHGKLDGEFKILNDDGGIKLKVVYKEGILYP